VCTFTQNLLWWQPLLQPGGCICASTIYQNTFPRASWDGRVTKEEASSIRVAVMEQHLKFRHQHWHWHILDYTSIRNWISGYNQHFHFLCRAEETIAMENHLQFRYRASSTVHQLRSTRMEKEMTINTFTSFVEQKLTFLQRCVSNFNTPPHNMLCQFRHTVEYAQTLSTSRASATVQQVMSSCGKREMIINTLTSFVERNSTSPPRTVSNFDTERITHELDQEAAYRNPPSFSCDHDTRGLCVTLGGAVDWKSR